jgi:hypothetical protein
MIDDGYTGFVVGRGIGLVTSTTIFLLDASNGPLAERAWALMQQEASSDELLEAISATGLRSLGSFALAQFEHVDDEQPRVRVVARGQGAIDVTTTDGTRSLSGAGVRTWLEDVVASSGSLVLRLDDANADGITFRAASGVLPAIALSRRLTSDPPALVDIELPDGAGLEGLIPQAPPPVVLVGTFESQPLAERSTALEALAPPTPETVEVAPVDLPAPTPVAGGSPPVAPARAAVDPGKTITRMDADVALAAETDAGSGEEYDYDNIYGRTVMRSVHDAAVSRPDPDLDAAPEATDAAVGQGGIIDGVPSGVGPVPTSGAPAWPQSGDHDGRTISRAQLAAMRAASSPSAEAPQPIPVGPMVQALVCPNDHPNPPQVAQCRSCGQLLGTATRTVIARPSLGRLRFSEGTEIGLDRPVLVGRNPRLEGQIANELPQLMKLSLGQGLSRTHAAVRLEGWQVYIEDLNSANGTILTLPGRAPRRLHAGEPALVEHGALIDFGGEVTCTFEQTV